MSKQLTERQLQTIAHELNASIDKVADAWRTHHPYPSWEEDAEWRRLNPSPRESHRLLEDEVRDALKTEANDLLLRLKLGRISPENAYDELKAITNRLNEQRLSYLNLPGSRC